MEVKGRDTVTGLPSRATITSIEIREALGQPVRQICESIRQVLERPRPRSRPTWSTRAAPSSRRSAPVRHRSGHLRLPRHPPRVCEDPLTAVARGTGVFLDKLDIFSRVLSADDEG